MADNTEDLRCKVSVDTHRRLDALCRALGESMQDRVRALIETWIASELHAHTLRTRLLRDEGIDAAGPGK